MSDRPALDLTPGSGGLRVTGLRKSYRKRPVIRDVSLHLDRGEVVALLGPNGSGKTTCFYSIAGLVSPEGGQVTIDGRDATLLPMYRRARLGIGYLPQEMSVFRGLNVEDNILAVLEIAEPDRTSRRERLEELLSDFSIGHLRRAPALALSGGERRRVEIARCLAANPRYVLLDEPFAGVDPIAVGDIRDLVAALKTRGLGVLITDHNVRETLGIVDRAYILHDGRVLMSGTTDEVVRYENVRRVYLGQGFPISCMRRNGGVDKRGRDRARWDSMTQTDHSCPQVRTAPTRRAGRHLEGGAAAHPHPLPARTPCPPRARRAEPRP